jgi:glyoxylase-like metal-dependent hydrolase (beta-lactamase superfamily II)
MGDQQSVIIPISMGMVSAFLINGERSILVDTGMRGSEQHILKTINQHNIAYKDISLIVITHGHNDHFGGAQKIREIVKAPIAIHPLDAEAFRQNINLRKYTIPTGNLGKFFNLFLRQSAPGTPVEPDILIEKELDLMPFGVNGKIIHTPGHTPGSISILLSHGDAIIGDILMADFLRHRKLMYPFYASDFAALKESLKTILSTTKGKLWLSHGGQFESDIVLEAFHSGSIAIR